ncbi:hypothetical protein BN874_170009 [Candidatus Contendobacter odensis Run_B_J11]|uniref:Uncharacterized protein n=1 Tax=Candidatus Contendobacter odensis Run_B_J11 TaxID=1400861 RepID=A0A7U7GA57_9GAMM|nr:hypothetical protein BN874_170009 [Candidatus Contendobacter odensis Run_B_J11]
MRMTTSIQKMPDALEFGASDSTLAKILIKIRPKSLPANGFSFRRGRALYRNRCLHYP